MRLLTCFTVFYVLYLRKDVKSDVSVLVPTKSGLVIGNLDHCLRELLSFYRNDLRLRGGAQSLCGRVGGACPRKRVARPAGEHPGRSSPRLRR